MRAPAAVRIEGRFHFCQSVLTAVLVLESAEALGFERPIALQRGAIADVA